MNNTEKDLNTIIAHSKEYGFIFPSSDMYDGLQAVYDYGPYGSLLKKNVQEYWWKSMVQMHQNIVGIDAAIFMSPVVWEASGHVQNFSDPLIDNKESKKRYRVDHLIEEYAEKLEDQEAKELLAQMEDMLGEEDFTGLENLIQEKGIKDPVSGSMDWTPIRKFNLMFSTAVGSVADDSSSIYLRPETAQGIFVNFMNVQKSARMKVPFGIAQVGKAFRNEIVARQFIFRMREFEQMEMQFFIAPGTQKEWYDKWKETRLNWHKSFGFPESDYQYHDHVQLAHYADMACDIEYKYPFGFRELEGIHSRTDFDLSRHAEFSKKKIQYRDDQTNEVYIPYVIETSIGLDRAFLSILCGAYDEEDLSKEGKSDKRTVLRIPKFLAPVKVAILPLLKKDGLPEKGQEIEKMLRPYMEVFYEEKGAIGKRYRRQDAIGTPYCLTIDHQSLEDNTVTIRERDTMEQYRIPIEELLNTLVQNTQMPL